MKTIIVGYDATEEADRALERAAQLAEVFKAKLIVTSVAPVAVPAVRGTYGAVMTTDTPESHEKELIKAQELLEGRSLTVEYQPALGDPAETIVEVAERFDADLIVVGTRELGILKRLLGLSVSESVQRRAHCDVLIAH